VPAECEEESAVFWPDMSQDTTLAGAEPSGGAWQSTSAVPQEPEYRTPAESAGKLPMPARGNDG
jgi:hypothetical protein